MLFQLKYKINFNPQLRGISPCGIEEQARRWRHMWHASARTAVRQPDMLACTGATIPVDAACADGLSQHRKKFSSLACAGIKFSSLPYPVDPYFILCAGPNFVCRIFKPLKYCHLQMWPYICVGASYLFKRNVTVQQT